LLDLVPKKLFLTRGTGIHEDRLTSFEYALREAGIAGTNVVLISSIFPPNAKLISKNQGLKLINPGQILFTIYSKNQTNEPHRLTAASVGVAQPTDKSHYGYLSEYESFGQIEKEAGDYAEDIAAQMHLILIRAGMKNDNNGISLEKFTKQVTLHKLQLVTKKADGLQFLLQQL